MNTQRMLILGVAAIAAGAAALLARSLLGGGTAPAKAIIPPPQVAMSEVLVAATNLQPGTQLTQASVRWQEWPKSAIDSSFITHDQVRNLDNIVRGAVVRASMVAGEPVTAAKIVHADSAGFMAAMVDQGMRAVSIGISTESGAGGFILPNDRVDVMVTGLVSDNPRRFESGTLLKDVRVLAVDQTYKEDKDQKVVLAKTATLELTPRQAELVEQAQAVGTISLALRALGDSGPKKNAKADKSDDQTPSAIIVIRYGVPQVAGVQGD